VTTPAHGAATVAGSLASAPAFDYRRDDRHAGERRIAGAFVVSALCHFLALFLVPFPFFATPSLTGAGALSVSFRALPQPAVELGKAGVRFGERRRPFPVSPPAPPPSGASAALAGVAYVVAEALEARPRVVDDRVTDLIVAATADYPPTRLALELWIAPTGTVEAVRVLASGGLPDEIVEQIVAGFRASRFLPGLRAGRAVGAIVPVEVGYAPVP
jgi:hypothetical protein